MCVSTVIKVKSESKSIQTRRPATRASLSRCQPRSMCSLSCRLAFQRCWVPVVAFVQQRDHTDAGAGAERTTTKCYQSVNSAITTKTPPLRSAGTVAMILFQTREEQSEDILRIHLLDRTALEARTLKQIAGTLNINYSLQ